MVGNSPPPPLQGPYPDLAERGCAELYEGQVLLTAGGREHEGHGQIVSQLTPYPRASFEGVLTPPMGAPQGFDCRIWLPPAGPSFDCLITGKHMSSSEPTRVTGILQGDLSFTEDRATASEIALSAVRFHGVNFPDCIGAMIGDGSASWAGRLSTTFGPWRMTLDQLRDCGDRLKEAGVQGRCTATHVGELVREDGVPFGIEEARAALEFAYWFLSFCGGVRGGPCLAEGRSPEGSAVWRDWTAPSADPPGRGSSWFPTMAPGPALSIADQAQSLWCSGSDRTWLRDAIALYLAANRNHAGCELANIWACTALDMLAYVVLSRRLGLSERRIPREHAVRVRQLIDWAGIPPDVPDTLRKLAAWAQQRNLNGPQAVVRIRNLMVHPTSGNTAEMQTVTPHARFEAWYLALWYVELALLKLLDYNGRYSSRVDLHGWRGQYELVPWASNPQPPEARRPERLEPSAGLSNGGASAG